MNTWHGIGNITKDLELRHTQSGKATCSFTLAINHGFGDKKQTDYINCVAWDKAAESLCQYMSKGKKVGVTGRIQTRSYEAQDGSRRYVTEIVCSEIEFLSPMGEKPEGSLRDGLNDAPHQRTDGLGTGDFEPLDDEQMPF